MGIFDSFKGIKGSAIHPKKKAICSKCEKKLNFFTAITEFEDDKEIHLCEPCDKKYLEEKEKKAEATANKAEEERRNEKQEEKKRAKDKKFKDMFIPHMITPGVNKKIHKTYQVPNPKYEQLHYSWVMRAGSTSCLSLPSKDGKYVLFNKNFKNEDEVRTFEETWKEYSKVSKLPQYIFRCSRCKQLHVIAEMFPYGSQMFPGMTGFDKNGVMISVVLCWRCAGFKDIE